MDEIEITTRDGKCPSYVFQPPADGAHGAGPWPAVLVYMDGIGIRPAMLEIGERLATHGYFVLLPDVFYRAGRYAPMDPKEIFGNPEKVKVLREKFFAAAKSDDVMSDTRFFLDWIDARPNVKKGAVGATGYCMGGRLSFIAAATFPHRVAAAAAYHPGRLVTDDLDSPHLLSSKIRARVYVAGASDDASFTDAQKATLEAELTRARVDHVVETYPAKHGWVLRDTPAYDETQAERHWTTLVALLRAKLGA